MRPMSCLVSATREQEQFAGDELVAALAGFLLGRLQQGASSRPTWTWSLPSTCGRRLIAASAPAAAGRCAGAREQRRGPSSCASSAQQVLGLDVGVVAGDRQALRFAQGFLEFGGQFVESHGIPPDPVEGAPAGVQRRRAAPARRLSRPGSAQQDSLGQAKTERGAGERADHVGKRVAEGEQQLAALQQDQRLDRERREGREAAEQAGQQAQQLVGRVLEPEQARADSTGRRRS